MNAQAQAETTQEGRDNKGRFTKENRFGVGNPHGRRVAELRKLMLSRCTDEVLDKAMDALIRLVEQ